MGGWVDGCVAVGRGGMASRVRARYLRPATAYLQRAHKSSHKFYGPSPSTSGDGVSAARAPSESMAARGAAPGPGVGRPRLAFRARLSPRAAFRLFDARSREKAPFRCPRKSPLFASPRSSSLSPTTTPTPPPLKKAPFRGGWGVGGGDGGGVESAGSATSWSRRTSSPSAASRSTRTNTLR